MRAGLQTPAPFTMRESPSAKPVRRVKLETVGRVVNPERMDYRARVWRPARTEAREVTAARLFLETMEEVLPRLKKIVVEPGPGGIDLDFVERK